jgi:hypothetical protein
MSWLSFTARKWFRCPDYRQAMRWARLERKSYKIPEPDIDVAAKAESGDLPLFLRCDGN